MFKNIFRMFLILSVTCSLSYAQDVPVWDKYEIEFQSGREYENSLYDLKSFVVEFVSPSGRSQKINGFWDGGLDWKVRFCPDETGSWTWKSSCSDLENTGLNNRGGTFMVAGNGSSLDIYQKGSIIRSKGNYHLTHADGTPFFWLADTAWNGAMRASAEEWDIYLKDRRAKGFNVIQFVTTQWRGRETDRNGEVAFTGSGRIRINPHFFQNLDERVDELNKLGLVAAPVLLWALPRGQGRELSPGYYLPEDEAVLLARYTVARYGGNQVIWILGGDGAYIGEFEQRWKNIGRRVFEGDPPGLVAQHPHGSSWIGEDYRDEAWLDIIGYQSSHSNGERVVNWINKGPMARQWDKLPARPVMNLEPNYEMIGNRISAEDVRNASYWSLFATPMSGLAYGHNSIWPWLYEGETIVNHEKTEGYPSWEKAIHFPGSGQVGYLAEFIRSFDWWKFRPALELLAEQPGEKVYNHFVSIVRNPENGKILCYLPLKGDVKIYNLFKKDFTGKWFDTVLNTYSEAEVRNSGSFLEILSPKDQDMVLILQPE
jgi:Protein of unknown function (DUF4038)/Domain of unknown function (DUF5060)